MPMIWYLRKPLGLYAAAYAGLHFLIFVWWSYDFNFVRIWQENADKPFILIGVAALLILIVLAATSFKSSQRKLGKKWTKLHKTAYLAGVLVILHYLLAIKGNLLTLQGNYTLPLILGGVLIVFLALRLPVFYRSKK